MAHWEYNIIPSYSSSDSDTIGSDTWPACTSVGPMVRQATHIPGRRGLQPQISIDRDVDHRGSICAPTPTATAKPAAGPGRWICAQLTHWRIIERVDHQCRGSTGRHRVDDAPTVGAQPRLGQIPRNDASLRGDSHGADCTRVNSLDNSSIALTISTQPETQGGAANAENDKHHPARSCRAPRRPRVPHGLTTASTPVADHAFASSGALSAPHGLSPAHHSTQGAFPCGQPTPTSPSN